MADIERGQCDICGNISDLNRKYYHYDIKCECHSPCHFELVRHCATCIPTEPKETTIKIKTDNLVKNN